VHCKHRHFSFNMRRELTRTEAIVEVQADDLGMMEALVLILLLMYFQMIWGSSGQSSS